MPTTKSAKKRLRQSEARRALHRSQKSTLRTKLRKVRELAEAGDAEKAQAELRDACRTLDKAGASRLIHKNKAARTKSRLAKLVKNAKAAKA